MVVNNLDIVGVSFPPHEAYTSLIIDADAVLSVAIAVQRLETISRGRSQLAKFYGRIQLAQLSQRHPLDGPEALDRLAPEETLSVHRAEAFDHWLSV